jgi:hypothetical protein
MTRRAVGLTSDRSEPVKAENAMQFPLRAGRCGNREHVRFCCLGPSVQVSDQVEGDVHLKAVRGELADGGLAVVACKANPAVPEPELGA